MKTVIRALLVLAFIGLVVTPSNAQQGLVEATVKVYSVYSEYDYAMPWQLSNQERGFGSGCIISGNRVLTNAHVVSNQTFVQVKRAGQAKN
jgi:S1-C subfamily serine protease